MGRKIILFLAIFALLLTGCKFYAEGGPVTSPNGLSCQNYTNYGSFQQGAECFYTCPDGTFRQPSMTEKFTTSSPLYSASKKELDGQFCAGVLPLTPTELPTGTSPTVTASPTGVVVASTTPAEVPIALPPLLTGEVTSCDRSMNLINFRLVESPPDLTGRTLTVQISAEASTCAVNPVNTTLLTCKTKSPLTFPMRVVVQLDGAVVNDFTADGLGCLIF
jgi:hypothetical protein